MKRLCYGIILGFILICETIFSRLANSPYPSFLIDYENDTFVLDGKPFRYISGSIHYFRIPSDYWNDRLQRIRAAGLNAIQFYIPWNYHEIYKGRYIFSGQRNITRFIELAASNQLFALVRFMMEVERWFNVLLPMLRKYLIRNGGPILMIQVENEYGSHYACDNSYMRQLADMIRYHLGPDVVQYTTDGSGESYLKCGTIPDAYPTIDFGPTSRERVDAYFNLQRRYAPHGPLINSEFYPGWLVVWGQTSQNLPSISKIIDTADYMYKLGANFNFYMFHGGTNFGFWNGAETTAPVITSYDYTAPLTEAGDITPKYLAIRNWLGNKTDWPHKPGCIPEDNLKIGYGNVKLQKILSLGKDFCELIVRDRSCRKSKYPISFEQLRHPFGFVMYYTTLKFDGTNLTIPLLKDRGYVLIDNELQGVLVNVFGKYEKHWLNVIGARENATLIILVENQGRQTIPTINDFKGLLSNVTLNEQIVDDWIQCGLHSKLLFSIVQEIERSDYNNMVHNNSLGLYVGHFHAKQLADTFFDSTNWGKGQVFINRHNIGRYWPSVGPQMTLYVPAPYLRRHNTVIVLELEKAGNCDLDFCSVNFIDHPIFNFTNSQPNQ